MTPTISSLVPWFGAKRTMAPIIVEALGPHTMYWELFCGSMAVLLSKPQCRTEVVNDLHGDLINLARCMQSPTLGPKLYRRLRRVLFSEDEFRDALSVIRIEDPPPPGSPLIDVDRAVCYFVASWQGMNGVAGTSATNTNFCRRYSGKGGDPAVRWVGAVRSIPQWRRRLERVQVLRSNAFVLAEKIVDEPGTVIYADPPYLKKGAKYLHDFTQPDHARLAGLLARFRRARVVVSYYEDERLKDLYPGWTMQRIDATKGMVNSGMRDQTGATKAPEVLLINDRTGQTSGRLFPA